MHSQLLYRPFPGLLGGGPAAPLPLGHACGCLCVDNGSKSSYNSINFHCAGLQWGPGPGAGHQEEMSFNNIAIIKTFMMLDLLNCRPTVRATVFQLIGCFYQLIGCVFQLIGGLFQRIRAAPQLSVYCNIWTGSFQKLRENSKISFYYFKIKSDFKMSKQKYSPYAYNQYFSNQTYLINLDSIFSEI